MVRSAQEKHDAPIAEDAQIMSQPLYPGAVIQALKRHVKQDAIICSDVGDHTYRFYKRFVCQGQTTLLCANMAGMGFGVPAGVACPKPALVEVIIDSKVYIKAVRHA